MLDIQKLLELEAQQSLGFDVVFSIGTSALFPYIVQPVFDAARQGIPTVEINPNETDLSHLVTYGIRARAAETLTRLARHLDA